MHYFQRKYVDLIRQVSSKWTNWEPSVPIEVGAYGHIESETGELRMEGNVYHADFQKELDANGIPLRMIDHPPQQGSVEDQLIISTKGAKRMDMHFGPELDVPGLATASLKGQWQFSTGKRDALLIMHKPLIRFLPHDVILEKLYKVPSLRDKWLVTSVQVCPAFSMYLSNKSGEKVSLALVAQVPVAAAAGVTAGGDAKAGWWSDTSADFMRKGCDEAGNYAYTPLYTLKRRIGRLSRMFRDKAGDKTGDDLWTDAPAPWPPLDEDGEVDAVEMDSPGGLDDI